MVIVHGWEIFFGAHREYGLPNWATLPLVFRCLFSICQPAFAGFYLRNQVGPVLDQKAGIKQLIRRDFEFLFLAIVIEAVRLYFWSLDIAPIFFWNALHFIALSFLITHVLLLLDRRMPLVLAVVLIFFKSRIDLLLRQHLFHAADLNPSLLSLGAALWSVAFGLMIGGVLLLARKQLRLSDRARQCFLWATITVPVLGAAYAYPHVIRNSGSILSLLNLPISIWTVGFDDWNFWPFLTFYPLFFLGYLMRDTLFDVRQRKQFIVLTGTALLFCGYFFRGGIWEYAKLTAVDPFAKGAYAMPETLLLSILGVFYLGFLVTYFVARANRWRIFDRWAYLSRNIILLYVIHPFFFAMADHVISFPDLAQRVGVPALILGYYVFSHCVYFITLYLADKVSTIASTRWVAVQA